MIANRPFEKRPLPEHGPDFVTVIPALLAECEAELDVLKSLSPLNLEVLNRMPRGEAQLIQAQCLGQGRYSKEFLDRHLDLSDYLYRFLKMKTDWLRELRSVPTASLEGAALAERQQKVAWWNAGMPWSRIREFQALGYPLRELTPYQQFAQSRSREGAPDNMADALSQGIGIRDL